MHERDDEAWHVLEGTLRFRFADRTVDVSAGGSVFVPAGVPHTFGNPQQGPVRYLIMMTPRIAQLIEALHAPSNDSADVRAVYRQYDSDLVE